MGGPEYWLIVQPADEGRGDSAYLVAQRLMTCALLAFA
jgi:hypothetical protein